MTIHPEQLAYWYFRLNGFLTIPNFIVHPDRGSNQETDIDVLGVRFPYRAENLIRPMKDDAHFAKIRDKTFIAIAEVKSERCALNGSWTNPERQNMHRVLRAIGAFPETESDLVAQSLYDKGHYTSQLYHVSLMCLGRESNTEVTHVPQILWTEVLAFIYRRFNEYKKQKVSHQQWDKYGHDLWNAFEKSSDEDHFREIVRVQSYDENSSVDRTSMQIPIMPVQPRRKI